MKRIRDVVWRVVLSCAMALVASCDRPAPSAEASSPRHGPWGQVTSQSILLAPRHNDLSRLDLADGPPVWRLRGLSDEQVSSLLAHLDLPDHQFVSLLGALQPTADGYTLTPPPHVVGMLGEQARASLYARLAQDPANRAQMNAFRYSGVAGEDWLKGWSLAPDTIARVKPLIYRDGGVLFFADTWMLSEIKDPDERTRLVQALAAEVSVQLTLHVPQGADIEALADYWSWPGAETDLRTLFRSLSERTGGGSIDVAHLLPPFARARLYRYPEQDMVMAGGDSRDCHWTALNFFNHEPDDRYANGEAVALAMQTRFDEVTEPRFGDLVVFRSGGEIYHSAVYIAADVLFTRNGTRFSRPWMLIGMEQMRDFYPRPDPVEVVFLRRKTEPEN